MNYARYFTASMVIGTVCLAVNDFASAESVGAAAVAPMTSVLPEYHLAQTSRAAQMRREIELRRYKMKKKMERQRLEMERQRQEMERRRKEAQRKAERFRKDVQRRQREIERSTSFPSRDPEAPPFNPSAAPDPKVCFEDFVKQINNAKSVDDFIIYLPLSDQRYLREEQAEYDPNDVPAMRAEFIEMRSDISEKTLDYLTQSPYEGAFKRYKRIAKKFRHTKSVNIDGNKATLKISTFSTAIKDGVEYNYSSATVELVGEANYWRMTGYEDSFVHYKYPQD